MGPMDLNFHEYVVIVQQKANLQKSRFRKSYCSPASSGRMTTNRNTQSIEFNCDKCDKDFISKATLKTHQIVHSKVKPFKCEYCGWEFNYKHNFNGHVKKFHSSKYLQRSS